MANTILQSLKTGRPGKKLAVLIDPDDLQEAHLVKIIPLLRKSEVDVVLVGGSLLLKDQMDDCLQRLKRELDQPLVLFPGSVVQVSPKADAILFLSLISGRNPEFLIGQHVVAAPYVKAAGLEVIPTGYMLIDGGRPTTASYISNAMPIPRNKAEIAVCTAMAGEMLGLQTIYMDAGSGADWPVPKEMIRAVSENTKVPLIVGGGIRDPYKAVEQLKAGADMIVVGTRIEENPDSLMELSQAVHGI
ncbi:MAG TPA: geranylgeranylglyceryl/heptaprenylglyceryl phosphate synthase [Saprospiraceae bacterium]|nr:geranylgeranylglyceryl/heptaprenylglyceryl phosphate synthase [Saprospiraceae bacterium]